MREGEIGSASSQRATKRRTFTLTELKRNQRPKNETKSARSERRETSSLAAHLTSRSAFLLFIKDVPLAAVRRVKVARQPFLHASRSRPDAPVIQGLEVDLGRERERQEVVLVEIGRDALDGNMDGEGVLRRAERA